MRKSIIILSIFSFFAKDIVAVSWQIWFVINQEQIAAEKCENKAIPMMHCNGKCYLAKQLKKIEQKEQQHKGKTNPYSNLTKTELYHQEFQVPPVSRMSVSPQKMHFSYLNRKSKPHRTGIFRPPIA